MDLDGVLEQLARSRADSEAARGRLARASAQNQAIVARSQQQRAARQAVRLGSPRPLPPTALCPSCGEPLRLDPDEVLRGSSGCPCGWALPVQHLLVAATGVVDAEESWVRMLREQPL